MRMMTNKAAKQKSALPNLAGKAKVKAKVKTKVKTEVILLRLYVAGQTRNSMAALTNLKKICEDHLAGRYKLKVIDLLKDPKLARGDQILAIPTLVRKLPLPVRKLLGDLSNTDRVLIGLDLVAQK